MATQTLDDLDKKYGAVADTPQVVAPREIAIPPLSVADQKAARGVFAQPDFFAAPVDQQRSRLRSAVKGLAHVPDFDLDASIEETRPLADAVRKQWARENGPTVEKPGVIRQIWEGVNSPVKALTGKSVAERYNEATKGFVAGPEGKLMESAYAADRAIKDAGFQGDPETSLILQANANESGRRLTRQLGTEATALAESPLTYFGLGEGIVQGAGAARAVARAGEAGKLAEAVLKSSAPKLAAVVGKAGTAAEKALKGVQTAQLWGTRAFQAQALAGAGTSVHNYVKDPTPENAASAIFGLGLGGLVTAHLAQKTKANYDAGGEAVRIMERARDLAWSSGKTKLETLPQEAAAEFIRQAGADVIAEVPGTEARTVPGKVKAAKDKAWRLARQAKAGASGEIPETAAPPETPTTPPVVYQGNPAATPEWAARNYQSQPNQEVILRERGGAVEPQYTVSLPEAGVQPAANFEANPNPNGFTMPGDGAPRTARPPMIEGSDGVYRQPQGDYAPPVQLAPPQGSGQVPAVRGPVAVQPGVIEANPLDRERVQPASDFEANRPQGFRMGEDPSGSRRKPQKNGQAQIEGEVGQEAFIMPEAGVRGPVQPAKRSARPPMDPVPPPVPTEPELMGDGSRKWTSGTFEYPVERANPEGETRTLTFPVKAMSYSGRPITVLGPAFPDGPGGLDPNQVFVMGDDGTKSIMVVDDVFLPKPGKEGSRKEEDFVPISRRNPNPPARPDTPLNRMVEQARMNDSDPEAIAQNQAAGIGAQPQQTPKPPLVLGSPARVIVIGQNDNKYKLDVKYAVVPRAAINVSHDTSFNPRPEFPAEIQPRNRGRAAGMARVNKIAGKLDLDQVSQHPEAGGGAPIMSPDDYALEAGNGRVIAINLAYERGLPTAGVYRQGLIDRAAEFGLDPAYVASVQDPVLVRVRTGELPEGISRQQFSRDTNKDDKEGMSPLEQALVDRDALTPEIMDLYDPESDLTSRSNAEFVQQFFKGAVDTADANKLQTAGGAINNLGVKRVEAALFSRAYGESPLLEAMAESTDPDVKAVISALLNLAPRMAKLDDAIAAGARHPLSISADAAWAGNKLAALKRDGTKVDDYLRQGNFLEDPPTPIQKDLLMVMDEFSRSGRKIGDVLGNFIDAVDGAGDPNQVSMFGPGDPPTVAGTLEAAIDAVKSEAEAAKLKKKGEPKNAPQVQQPGPEGSSQNGAGPAGVSGEEAGPEPGPAVASRPKPAAEVGKPPAAEGKSLVDDMMADAEDKPLFQRTKRPPSLDLFPADDESALAKRDKEKLLGERLTAQFNSQISAQENAAKLKKKPELQESFFEALPDDPQTRLFMRGMDKPVPMKGDKPDVEGIIRDAKILVKTGGKKAARVYVNPSAKQIIMNAQVKAGITSDDKVSWRGAAMKTAWVERISDQIRAEAEDAYTFEEAKKYHELANELDRAIDDGNNVEALQFIDARHGWKDVKHTVHHEQQHADQWRIEPRANFKPGELFGMNNLRDMAEKDNYKVAAMELMSRGYRYAEVPVEAMAHTASMRVDPKTGMVDGLNITPEAALNLYADLLEAGVATKGRIAYTMVSNAKRSTVNAIRELRRRRRRADSGSVEAAPVAGQRTAPERSPQARRTGGADRGRNENLPRTKRPPG